MKVLLDNKIRLERIHNKELPALISAYEISRQGESITTAASELIIAQDKWARDAFVNRIEDKFNWIDTQLGIIVKLGYDSKKINNINGNEKALKESFNDLLLALKSASLETKLTTKKNSNGITPISDKVNYQLLLNGRRADSMTFSVADLTSSVSGEINRMIAEVQISIDNSLWQITMYSFGVTFFALLVVLYLDNNVGRRVVGIQQAMSAIANGNKGEEIPDGGNDEISDMGVALRTFVEKLEEREELLKKNHEEAVSANKAKSDFLAAMSHDLRTPLNSIIGFSDMMRSKVFGPLGDPHYEEYANDINNSGELLIRLINNILDLSKVEAGKHELSEEPLHIPSLIQGSVKMVAAMAEMQKLHLAMDIDTGLPMLRGDGKSLTQVLNNLLSNAVKFTPEGGKVTVSARLKQDSSINIMVADTGCGMSRHDVTRSLRPFEQVSQVHSKKHKGTGLGLHICVNLIKLLDGEMEIESEVGKGTTITLHFSPERTIYASN